MPDETRLREIRERLAACIALRRSPEGIDAIGDLVWLLAACERQGEELGRLRQVGEKLADALNWASEGLDYATKCRLRGLVSEARAALAAADGDQE
jgi:hypothetical protein